MRKKTFICYVLCFSVPVLLMLLVYARLGVHPFGAKSLLVIDMDSQLADFYEGLRHMLSGKTSPLFSWHMALGNNYWGLFTYYLSSPLSLIPLLFPSAALPDGILVLTLFKIGLCGLSFGVFVRKVYRIPNAVLPGFATAYALMASSVLYTTLPMWLDTVALLPMMALGVELLLKEGRRLPLIGWMTLCIVSNYYTAYMAVLFLLLWFLYRLALMASWDGFWRFFLRKVRQFVLCGATSGGFARSCCCPPM